MLTQPINDTRCLTMMLLLIINLLRDPKVRALASKYKDTDELIADIRSRPQLYDAPWVLPNAPRLPCHPPVRVRFAPQDPHCVERSIEYCAFAELLDPDTPRTLATVDYRGQKHVLPVEHTKQGYEPVILDPRNEKRRTIPENLSHAAVAAMVGYAPGQASPLSDPQAWAQDLAARDGLDVDDHADLMTVARQYAHLYPGGRQGLADLAEEFGESLKDAAEDAAIEAAKAAARAGYEAAKKGAKAGKAAKKAGKAAAKAGKKFADAAAEEYRKRPEIGQLLRSALVGYGGPISVIAIDVVESQLNKRGYTLGSLAESRDTDAFAFK